MVSRRPDGVNIDIKIVRLDKATFHVRGHGSKELTELKERKILGFSTKISYSEERIIEGFTLFRLIFRDNLPPIWDRD